MERIIGKAYPFKQKNIYYNSVPWEARKVIGFDKIGRVKTETLGAFFYKEERAREFCYWWNYKYFSKQENAELSSKTEQLEQENQEAKEILAEVEGRNKQLEKQLKIAMDALARVECQTKLSHAVLAASHALIKIEEVK